MGGKVKFGSKAGLIAATVGSAVGLGNVWRFPSEVQTNGGATFLIVYIACVFLLGIPVMLAEFSLGRGGNSDAVGAFSNLTPKKKWWLIGLFGIVASYLILSFYMVVAGWTLEYFWQSLSGSLYETSQNADGAMNSIFNNKMKESINDSWNPLLWTFIMILLNLGILLKGVKKGIEGVSNVLMPLLFILLLVFCVVSLSLPNAMEGVKFFLSPDFSKMSGQLVLSALGQAFFSLSLGMGILITYAAYYPHNTKLGRTAITVSMLDFIVALLMGLIIFPAVKSFGLEDTPGGLDGPTLVFVTLPEVFTQMPGTQVWSSLFFLLLSVAALTSTISLAEVSISLMQDRFKLSRTKSCLIVILPLFIFSSICSLSQGPLSNITIGNLNIFDSLDALTTKILLPISSILICVYVGWVLPKNFMQKELSNHGQFKSHVFPFVYFIVKYLAPIFISAIMIFQLIK